MIDVELTSGTYAAHWGLTDLYPEAEKKLREAVDSGEEFFVEYGCKKEIRYAKIVREDDTKVTVFAHMDDLYEDGDLIMDALWSRCKSEDGFDEDVTDDICEEAYEEDINDVACVWSNLPRNASYDEIMTEIGLLENKAERELEVMFDKLCDIVERYYNAGRSDSDGKA